MSPGDQRIKWRRNFAENFNRLIRVHERYIQTDDKRQTDDRRETDRRTDGRRHIANVNVILRSLIIKRNERT